MAALLIVLFHFPNWNNYFYDYTILRKGYLMVDLFFVLSGFVIFRAYSNKIRNLRELFRFQSLRFWRLYPVYFLFLGIFIFIELAKYIAQNEFGIISPNSEPFVVNNATALIQSLFLLQAIGPTGNAMTFNIPAWSISVEFYTYLVFGFVVLYLPKFKNIVFSLLLLISFFLLFTGKKFGFDYLLSCFSGFFLGCLVFVFKEKTKFVLSPCVPNIIIIILLIYLNINFDRKFDIAIYFLSALLIYSIALTRGSLTHLILNSRLVSWLGNISYSMYMSHTAILWCANQTIRHILKKNELFIEGKFTPQLNFFEALAAYILILAFILIISNCINKMIENPFRSKGRSFFT